MSTEKSRCKDEDMMKRSENIVNSVPSECLEDPSFVKVLATSLLSEIATLELILNETDAEIKGLKENVVQGLEKRKVLKEFTQVYTNKNAVLNTAFESLERDATNRSIEVEIVKNRLDDASLREIADRNQFKKLLDDYHEKWQKYKANYEERPLAKERRKAYVTLKQLRAKLMMIEYEKHNLITMLKQRKNIDNMRAKVSIVEISKMVLQRWKDQKYIQNLNVAAKQLQDKLDACTSQLSQLEQEEEKKERSKIESSMMPPPRLDFSFMRSICTEQGNYFKKRYPTSIQMCDLDSMSVNTLMLEEMSKTPANDEVIDLHRKNTQPFEEDEEQSLNLPTSVSIIQEIEPIYPICNQNDETSASELTANQTDIQDKLKKLCIKKKTTFVLDKEQQKRNAECNIDNDRNNDSIVNERKNYELSIVESHRRTLRWCKESQDEFAPFLLSGQRSNSLNDQSKSNLSFKEGNKPAEKKFSKASSICGSETKSLCQAERNKKFKNGAPMEVDDNNGKLIDQMATQEQRKRPSGEKLRGNISIGVGASQSREKEMQNEISSPAIKTPANSQQIYETPQQTMLKLGDNIATRESIVSEDNSETPIDASCSKPKIRKIEAVNFPFGQRPKDTDVMRQFQPDISYSPKHYVSSCMSSNLSNTFEAALQEIPQGSLCGDNQALSGIPSLANWKNWSPPNSERSLASSISKIGQNKETNGQTNPHHQQSQDTHFDLGSFFSMKPSQNPNNIF